LDNGEGDCLFVTARLATATTITAAAATAAAAGPAIAAATTAAATTAAATTAAATVASSTAFANFENNTTLPYCITSSYSVSSIDVSPASADHASRICRLWISPRLLSLRLLCL
jgi:hypothetical protein